MVNMHSSVFTAPIKNRKWEGLGALQQHDVVEALACGILIGIEDCMPTALASEEYYSSWLRACRFMDYAC